MVGMRAFCSLALIPLACSTATATATDPKLNSVRSELAGVWSVEALGSARALRIEGGSSTLSSERTLRATYSGAPTELIVNEGPEKVGVVFTSASGTKIQLVRESKDRMVGTFQSKASSGDIVATRLKATDNSAIAIKCGLAEGFWEGQWAKGDLGIATLWIERIDENCMASIRYGRVSANVRVIDSSFEFPCNQNTGGICKSKLVGEQLSTTYSNPKGGTNSADFRHVK